MLMLYGSFFLTVTLAVYTIFALRDDRSRRLARRLARVTGGVGGALGSASADGESAPPSGKGKSGKEGRKLLASLRNRFGRTFHRSMQEGKVAKLELKLLQAGRPFGMTPVDYRLFQLTVLLGLPTFFLGYSLLLGLGGAATLLFTLVAVLAGLVLPGYYLQLKAKQRARTALRELPDVLDLLTVSLEAGLGFDSALNKLISKKQGVLSFEFARCLEEIRLGKTRREALSGVRERLLLDEVKVLISSILQAEKLGIGMVQVLRVQSEEVREQRKQRAEEAAMKAPIKMLFPLVLFIFPTLFIVLLGPAAIQAFRTFTK